MPVRRFLTSTLAPFTDAPDGSVTVPWMVPFVPCACTRINELPVNVDMTMKIVRLRNNLVCIIPFPWQCSCIPNQNACKLTVGQYISSVNRGQVGLFFGPRTLPEGSKCMQSGRIVMRYPHAGEVGFTIARGPVTEVTGRSARATS